jgi:uncharacterized protein YcbK (DUF882 family)
MTRLSTHFLEAEFACNHCGKLHDNGVPRELVTALEFIRAHFGGPVNINSGYRCWHWNKQVGGALNSKHLLGTAADFWIPDVDPRNVFHWLDPFWPGGLGSYATFTHIDTRFNKVRWTE